MKFFAPLLSLLLISCSSGKLTDREKAVRILKKSDPEKNCKEIDKVIAIGVVSMDDYGREDDLKRETYKIGGDTVTIDRIDEGRTHYGTAYKCN